MNILLSALSSIGQGRNAVKTRAEFVPAPSLNWNIGKNEETGVVYFEVQTSSNIHFGINGVGEARTVTVSNCRTEQELWSLLGDLGLRRHIGVVGVPFCSLGVFVRRRRATASVAKENRTALQEDFRSANETDRGFVLDWLEHHPHFENAEAGPLRDAWHGWN